MLSATRIKDRFTCRHRGCRWGRLACGSSTSGPCFPGPCPCKQFNLIQSPPNWKLILLILGSSFQQEDLVVRILGQPAQQRGCQNDDGGDDGGRELKHNGKNLLISSTPVGEHTSSTSSTDHHLLVRIIHWKIARRNHSWGDATLSYSFDSQAELAMPLLPILGAASVLFVVVEEEKSLFWVEKPLARFTSRPWPMLYCQKE